MENENKLKKGTFEKISENLYKINGNEVPFTNEGDMDLIPIVRDIVEQGKDVVVLVDSLTRLTRGNNLVVEPSGRTLTGGLDPESLYFPKKFFGSARNIEGGGSLTILATALVDTGSRMDDIIFEEFKGTGNMELHLERELAERRIFPAINLNKSGTRREEKLLTPDELKVSYQIRKLYAGNSPVQLTDKIINTLERTTDNEDFLKKILQKSKS